MSDIGHGGALLSGAQIDNLGRALLTLAQEVWVLRDRQRVMEAALADQDIVLDLDRYQPGEDLKAALADERRQFVQTILKALTDGG